MFLIQHKIEIGNNKKAIEFFYENDNLAFDYYTAVEVSAFSEILVGIRIKELPSTRYIFFSFKGKNQNSLWPVVEYIYRERSPQFICLLNKNAGYNFVKYGEMADEDGNSNIEYWIPIL